MEKLLTTQEAMERLGMSRTTLYRYIKEGELGEVHRRGTGKNSPLMIFESAVEGFLERHPGWRR